MVGKITIIIVLELIQVIISSLFKTVFIFVTNVDFLDWKNYGAKITIYVCLDDKIEYVWEVQHEKDERYSNFIVRDFVTIK